MKQIIEKLVAKSQKPLADKWLEGLQIEYNERHNYYRFLYHLVDIFKPAIALEIGTWYGIGSACMCAAAKKYDGQVIGIDLNYNELAASVLPERFENYRFLRMDSREAGPLIRQLTQHRSIDLVFQDSSHHYQASCDEWEIYSPLAHGFWLCDDITPAFHDPKVDPPGKGMVEYFNELPGKKMLFSDVLHYGNTMGLVFL